jgi:hypothetical protein
MTPDTAPSDEARALRHRIGRHSPSRAAAFLGALLAAACAGQGEDLTIDLGVDEQELRRACPAGDSPADAAPINEAFHLAMRDGVRIAVDLWLPGNANGCNRVPTVIRSTTYWRDQDVLNREVSPETATEAEAKNFVANGYAEIIVDARGSGASFGTRGQPWSAQEVSDYGQIVDWIVAQSWSNGRVGTFGTSYDSNTAEMTGTLGKRAVRAVASRFGFPDLYTGVVFPGGIYNAGFLEAWLGFTRALDLNDVCGAYGISGPECDFTLSLIGGVKRVDTDADGALRQLAVDDHLESPDQLSAVELLDYSDDLWNGQSFGSLSPGLRSDHAERTQTAFMSWVGWMDTGMAQGALNRWATTNVPMVVIIGPWGHDAASDANPFLPKDSPLALSQQRQQELTIEFLDQYLKPAHRRSTLRKILYFTLGENRWKETREWPPKGTQMTPFYLHEQNSLSRTVPSRREPSDAYVVDFTATTGTENGWWTKLASADVYYGDRAAEDQKLLAYTSAPFETDTEITGHPEITLHLSSTETDGAVFVYLEDVAPDGSVTYVTEGQLRLLHRKLCSEPSAFNVYGPCHSYARGDARPMPRGALQEIKLGLNPTSVLIRRGHSIRVAIAGHDASIFARIPAEGTPTLTIAHNAVAPSRIDLPIARRDHSDRGAL